MEASLRFLSAVIGGACLKIEVAVVSAGALFISYVASVRQQGVINKACYEANLKVLSFSAD